MGNLEYPKRRLRSFQVKAEHVIIHHGTKTMPLWPWKHELKTSEGDTLETFNSEEVGDLVITFDSRKLLVSQNHEDNYHHSIFWHKKDGALGIKLRRPNSVLCPPWLEHCPAKSTHIDQRNSIRQMLDSGLELPLDYRCVICSRWHKFELMYKPQYRPKNLGLREEEKKKFVSARKARLDTEALWRAAFDLGFFKKD